MARIPRGGGPFFHTSRSLARAPRLKEVRHGYLRGEGRAPLGAPQPRRSRAVRLMGGSSSPHGQRIGLREALVRVAGPDGPTFVELLTHGTLTVEIFSPRGRDPQ